MNTRYSPDPPVISSASECMAIIVIAALLSKEVPLVPLLVSAISAALMLVIVWVIEKDEALVSVWRRRLLCIAVGAALALI